MSATDWLLLGLIAAMAVCSLWACWKGWRLDTRVIELESENARLKATVASQDKDIAQWHKWARSEGWGQTVVVSHKVH